MEIVKIDKKRIFELDILRGIACLLVVLFHYTTRYSQLYGHSKTMVLDLFFGSKGFNLFFIISGFVIYMTLEGTKRPIDFVFSRFSRLFPAYWVAIALTFAFTHVFGLEGRLVSFGQAIVNLTMLQSFVKVPNVDNVYWTLQIELLFYFLMLIIFYFNKMKSINNILSAVLLGGILYKILIMLTGNPIKIFEYIRTFLIIDYLGWFSLGIIFYKFYKQSINNEFSGFLIIALSCISIFIDSRSYTETIVDYLVIILFAVVVFSSPKLLKTPILLFLGTVSYSLYLIHQNIGYVLMRELYKFKIEPYLIIVLAIFLSLFLASVLTFFVEKPAMNFLRIKYRERLIGGYK